MKRIFFSLLTYYQTEQRFISNDDSVCMTYLYTIYCMFDYSSLRHVVWKKSIALL